MGISEREYQEMLRRNNQLVARDDGRPHGAHHAAYRLTEAAHPAPTEHEEQVALFAWAAVNAGAHPELSLLFAIPNGGYRPMATAAMLSAEGVKAGVPDCCLPVARGRYHSLWLELKRKDHSNHATPAQLDWIERLRDDGCMAVVAYGADEAIKTIEHYLSLDERSTHA